MDGVTLPQIGLFVSTLVVAILSPGPGIVAVSQAAFRLGRSHAYPYALGLAIGASAWCLAALLGLNALFRAFPSVETAFHILGGLYLLWFAWKLWTHAPDPLPEAGADRGWRFVDGLVLNLSNPKPGLFYGSILLSIFPALAGAAAMATVYLTALSVELVFYLGLATLLAAPVFRARYFGAKLWIDRVAAVLVAILGLLLIVRH